MVVKRRLWHIGGVTVACKRQGDCGADLALLRRRDVGAPKAWLCDGGRPEGGGRAVAPISKHAGCGGLGCAIGRHRQLSRGHSLMPESHYWRATPWHDKCGGLAQCLRFGQFDRSQWWWHLWISLSPPQSVVEVPLLPLCMTLRAKPLFRFPEQATMALHPSLRCHFRGPIWKSIKALIRF